MSQSHFVLLPAVDVAGGRAVLLMRGESGIETAKLDFLIRGSTKRIIKGRLQ